VREPRRPPSVDCSSAALAARANKRRFVNLLQGLARPEIRELVVHLYQRVMPSIGFLDERKD